MSPVWESNTRPVYIYTAATRLKSFLAQLLTDLEVLSPMGLDIWGFFSRLGWLAEEFDKVKRCINIAVRVIHVQINQNSEWNTHLRDCVERGPFRQLFLTSHLWGNKRPESRRAANECFLWLVLSIVKKFTSIGFGELFLTIDTVAKQLGRNSHVGKQAKG